MKVTAHLRYLRIAPRKVRAVAGLLKGLDVSTARAVLSSMPTQASGPLLKLLNSAVANAEHNFSLDGENLYVWSVLVNEGPKLKRFLPRARGMTSPIQKKSSHVSVILEERIPGKKKAWKPKAPPAPLAEASKAKSEVSRPVAKPKAEKKIGLGRRVLEAGRRVFRRKAV
ncbi:50S ribosomal protein L22 [Candidatus Azambacteria bacterium]|nr:50S ribosomal protein L22 [Candidatus Azambacteria bacterium]